MKILSGSSSNFAPKWFLNLIICSSTSPQQQAVSYGFGNGGTESPSEAWLATWWQFWTHIYSLRQFWGVAARVKKSHQDYKEVKLDHHLLLCTNQDKRPHGDKTSQELRMLSSVAINCQVNKECHEFRFSIVCIIISVSNVTTSQSFFGQVRSPHHSEQKS